MNDTELIILGSLGLVGLSALKILKLKNIVNMFNILIPFIDFQGHPSSSMIDRNQLAGLPYSIGDVDFIALCDTGADQVYLDPTTADLVNLASYPKAPPSPGTPSGGHIVPLCTDWEQYMSRYTLRSATLYPQNLDTILQRFDHKQERNVHSKT